MVDKEKLIEAIIELNKKNGNEVSKEDAIKTVDFINAGMQGKLEGEEKRFFNLVMGKGEELSEEDLKLVAGGGFWNIFGTSPFRLIATAIYGIGGSIYAIGSKAFGDGSYNFSNVGNTITDLWTKDWGDIMDMINS